jgi:hypothetical protein
MTLAGCSLCTIASVWAQDQNNDGFTAQAKPGIAMVKPEPWSSPGSATVVEFKGLTDRTVPNAPGAGYYEFDDGAGNKNQVAASRVVVLYIYPNIGGITTIETADDRQKIQSMSDEVSKLESRYPATRAYVDSYARQIADTLQKYDGGQVEVAGQWVSKDSFARQKAQNLVNLLSDDITHAKPVSGFDLENDARFLQLQQLVDGQPTLQSYVDKVQALYKKQGRTEKRAALITQLNYPTTTRDKADALVAELRALQPDEDPNASAYLRSWDACLVSSVALNKQLASAQEAFEAAAVNIKPPTPNPSLPLDVTEQAEKAGNAVAAYKAAHPPLQIPVDYDLATGLSVASSGLSSLGSEFILKQFFEAKATVDQISAVAKFIGPKTVAAVTTLQDYIAKQIIEFKNLQQEGKLLIKSKKPADAYAKYKDAYAIIQDPALKQEMDKLKASLPQVSP